MKIKVCGLKDPENIRAILDVQPDFMGFIFYDKSPRCVGPDFDLTRISFPEKVNTVGVFVNTPLVELQGLVLKNNLNFVQLHGNESADYVKELAASGVKVIKVFQVDEDFNWASLADYTAHVSYFLFDTPTIKYGGSGQKFNWQLLENYKEEKGFLLSGGLEESDLQSISKYNFPQLKGIDVNSKFETAPGIKNVERIGKLINQVRNEHTIQRK